MTYRLKKVLIRPIIHPLLQRHIDSIILALANARFFQFSCSWKELGHVKRCCHNTIRCIEGFLDAISMVDIDVNIEHALMISQ